MQPQTSVLALKVPTRLPEDPQY